ncbi:MULTISPECIES: hypothetical protein [Pontibacillus]|uniref:DoxX-like protein n=1 Tax=Pontibacillus chungwhensis TaxID=265426 RepID=A0ABY8UXN4_9BACI|nr:MULTISPECIES: hypothetical protein [Pontibacillus]MCD5325961.1 hypothetical protein [Pontibacillus sp. HN14]WIF98417.1 hypothetical protein QNI29_01735 [Pontibacillus chungwhensis]
MMKLIVGSLLIVMSIVHVIYGEKMQVDEIKKLHASNILMGSFRVMSLQGGMLLFAVGIVEILTFYNLIVLSGVAAYIPLGILCLNVVSLLTVSLIKHPELIKATIPQLLIFLIIIILELLSVR